MSFFKPSWLVAVGGAVFFWGTAGVVLADSTDNTCYMSASKNAGGNWIGPPTQANCNTTDCPPDQGGPGACMVRESGASSAHPGYNTRACWCSPTQSGIYCELLYYYNPNDPGDFFYACPTPPCGTVPATDCKMDGTGPYRCKCK